MTQPKTTHTKSNEKKEKLRRIIGAVMKNMEGVFNDMLSKGELENWDEVTRENLVKKRKELRALIEKATVGRTPKLESKICLLACQSAYLHDGVLRKDVEDGWG